MLALTAHRVNFIAARSLPRSIHRRCVSKIQLSPLPSLLLPHQTEESKIPERSTPPIISSLGWIEDRRVGKMERMKGGRRRRDLYNQSNIVDKSSARNPSAKINYGRLPGFGQRAIRIPHTRASSSPPLGIHTLLPHVPPRPSPLRPVDGSPWSPSPSSLAPALFIPHFNPPTPLLQNKFAAIFLFRGPHIYILYIYIMCTYIYIYIFRVSTPRRRVFHAAKKAPGGSRGVLGWFCFLDNLWLDCVYVDGWSGGWLHTWVDGGLNNEEGRGVARWHGYAGGCSTLGTGVRW